MIRHHASLFYRNTSFRRLRIGIRSTVRIVLISMLAGTIGSQGLQGGVGGKQFLSTGRLHQRSRTVTPIGDKSESTIEHNSPQGTNQTDITGPQGSGQFGASVSVLSERQLRGNRPFL